MKSGDQVPKPECATLGLKDGGGEKTRRCCKMEVPFGNGLEHPDVIFEKMPHIADAIKRAMRVTKDDGCSLCAFGTLAALQFEGGKELQFEEGSERGEFLKCHLDRTETENREDVKRLCMKDIPFNNGAKNPSEIFTIVPGVADAIKKAMRVTGNDGCNFCAFGASTILQLEEP